jgi:serine/threonine-protein kinase
VTVELAAPRIAGTTIAGRYRVEAVIDEGGDAVLYQARHEALGKRVALKVLHAAAGQSKDAAARFLARAKLAASLKGPYVNRIADFGQWSEGSYIVMDWVDGEPLSAWMSQSETRPLDEVVDVVHQMAGALAAAHACDVVHGSLEPRRVLVVRQGDERCVKVLGFGERADAGGEGIRADVRALGGLLLELASRARFDGVTTFAVRRQREHELTPDIGPKVRKLPAALQAIVVKALALETTKVYRTAQDVSDDLERLRTGEIPDALLEMIASGSWALIPEERPAANEVRRVTGARANVPGATASRDAMPKVPPLPHRTTPRGVLRAEHRRAAVLVGLIAAGLAAGWVVSGVMAPKEESAAVAAGTARTAPTDFRPFGPDE